MSASANQLERIKHEKIEPLISDLIVPPSEGNLHKFLSLMTEKGIQEVLLPEHRQCSMISMTEILRCGNVENVKPTTVMVHVPVLSLDATIGQAARIMADYKIKVIPISDARKIIGQVNSSSMLRLLQGNLGNLKVSSLATQNPITIAADGFVATARELMVRKRIDHLPVKERDKLIGILTSAQIISVMSPRGRISTKVNED